jgi:hypothetical protein
MNAIAHVIEFRNEAQLKSEPVLPIVTLLYTKLSQQLVGE